MSVVFQLRGTLTVTNETELTRLTSDSKKKGFKFELKTLSPNGDNKINRFKVGSVKRLNFNCVTNLLVYICTCYTLIIIDVQGILLFLKVFDILLVASCKVKCFPSSARLPYKMQSFYLFFTTR